MSLLIQQALNGFEFFAGFRELSLGVQLAIPIEMISESRSASWFGVGAAAGRPGAEVDSGGAFGCGATVSTFCPISFASALS